MPLVDYGYSDESENEDSNEATEGDVEMKNISESVKKCESSRGEQPFQGPSKETPISENKLFSSLPVPVSNLSLGVDAFTLLNRNKKQPVKIAIPSLSDLDDGDSDQVKKKKPSIKGSGLFALLPAPKNINNLVPKSVTNQLISNAKNKPTSVKKSITPITPKRTVAKPKSTISYEDDDEKDDQDGNPTSFFFTNDENEVYSDLVNSSELKTEDTAEKVDFTPSSFQNSSVNKSINGNEYISFSENIKNFEESQVQNQTDLNDLDDEAIEKLCGARARKRKGEMAEEIIEINVGSIVGDAYRQLSKDLTREHEHRGFKKVKSLSSVERRKHQITYLASQAKEKEMELRNHWANSRMTRKQTQSKYGF